MGEQVRNCGWGVKCGWGEQCGGVGNVQGHWIIKLIVLF